MWQLEYTWTLSGVYLDEGGSRDKSEIKDGGLFHESEVPREAWTWKTNFRREEIVFLIHCSTQQKIKNVNF